MTAVNVFCEAHKVHLITDGAAFDAAGNLAMLIPKVSLLPHLNAAFAVRGAVEFISPLATAVMLSGATTYDQLKAGLADHLRSMEPQIIGFMRATMKPEDFLFDIVVAGISEERGVDAYMISNLTRAFAPAWSRTDIEGGLLTPSNDELQAEFENPAGDIEQLAVRLVERQRQLTGPDVSACGGFVQVTTITPVAIHTRIVHRWIAAHAEQAAAVQQILSGCNDGVP